MDSNTPASKIGLSVRNINGHLSFVSNFKVRKRIKEFFSLSVRILMDNFAVTYNVGLNFVFISNKLAIDRCLLNEECKHYFLVR